jgi:hypothetical protein
VVAGGLFVSDCHPTKLFQFAEAAFDEVTVGVEMLVERVFQRSGGVVRMTSCRPDRNPTKVSFDNDG